MAGIKTAFIRIQTGRKMINLKIADVFCVHIVIKFFYCQSVKKVDYCRNKDMKWIKTV